ncbi:hypothetical protein FRB99_003487, partial [Tulasnella sp. 403]
YTNKFLPDGVQLQHLNPYPCYARLENIYEFAIPHFDANRDCLPNILLLLTHVKPIPTKQGVNMSHSPVTYHQADFNTSSKLIINIGCIEAVIKHIKFAGNQWGIVDCLSRLRSKDKGKGKAKADTTLTDPLYHSLDPLCPPTASPEAPSALLDTLVDSPTAPPQLNPSSSV